MYADVIIKSIHFYKKRYVILKSDQDWMNIKNPYGLKYKNLFGF